MSRSSEQHLVILCRNPDGSVEELPASRIDEIDRLTDREGTLVWAIVTAPDDAKVERLGQEFRLHPLALEDLRRRQQRPKLDSFERQHMVVAYEVAPEAPDGLSEIHVFVGAGWLLSVNWAPAPMLESVRHRFGGGAHDEISTTGQLLYAILDAAVDTYFPELDRLSDHIDEIEERVLAGESDPQSLGQILRLKRRLLELRRVLAPMRDVANALLRRDIEVVDAASAPYYQDLYDHIVRVLDQLDVYRDLLAAVLDARLTVASNSLNAIMKRLTAFTVVLMVPTLIAGVYGMNFEFMPELDWPFGYPLVLGVMLLTVVALVAYFGRKGWF